MKTISEGIGDEVEVRHERDNRLLNAIIVCCLWGKMRENADLEERESQRQHGTDGSA
jgi:hypothetical protein